MSIFKIIDFPEFFSNVLGRIHYAMQNILKLHRLDNVVIHAYKYTTQKISNK